VTREDGGKVELTSTNVHKLEAASIDRLIEGVTRFVDGTQLERKDAHFEPDRTGTDTSAGSS
jgi:hypothetical protein